METKVSLKCFVNDCLCKYFFASNSPQISSNLISLRILITLRPFTQSQFKIRAIKLQKISRYLATAFLIFSLKLKFGIKKAFKFVLGRFLER